MSEHSIVARPMSLVLTLSRACCQACQHCPIVAEAQPGYLAEQAGQIGGYKNFTYHSNIF